MESPQGSSFAQFPSQHLAVSLEDLLALAHTLKLGVRDHLSKTEKVTAYLEFVDPFLFQLLSPFGF